MATTALAWLRRDLRAHDNPAIDAARDAADRVLCVFIVEPEMLRSSAHRGAAFARAVLAARDTIRARGGRLIVRLGPAREAIPALAQEVSASHVFTARDVTPRADNRDRAVTEALARADLAHTPEPLVHPLSSIVNNAGAAYKIFGPYHRRWATMPVSAGRAPRLRAARAADDPAAMAELREREGAHGSSLAVAEPAAIRALLSFARRAGRYAQERHRLDGAGGSMLSAALRTGALSPRRAAVTIARAGAGEWLRQLAWRDFASSSVAAYPAILSRSVRAPRRRWSRDLRALEEWRTGATGEPVIDEAMRRLARDGWISNRARMTVASFLCRDLGIDWREGARHFMHMLIDGDPAVNAVNWQWVAGTGFDVPAPYWRLSPERQGERHDPDRSFLGYSKA